MVHEDKIYHNDHRGKKVITLTERPHFTGVILSHQFNDSSAFYIYPCEGKKAPTYTLMPFYSKNCDRHWLYSDSSIQSL